jgi:hypothetical protein
MTAALEASAIYQLIGRIIYFHVLFIEPALSQPDAAGPAGPCCRHARPPVSASAAPGAEPDGCDGHLGGWAGLEEIAHGLQGCYRPCRWPAPCCRACVIGRSGAAIVTAWAGTECSAYGLPAPGAEFLAACAGTAAQQMAAAFAQSAPASCAGGEVVRPAGATLASVGELPLTAELLQLWREPGRVSSAPVISWLNHCSSLADIRSERDSRRTDGDPYR